MGRHTAVQAKPTIARRPSRAHVRCAAMTADKKLDGENDSENNDNNTSDTDNNNQRNIYNDHQNNNDNAPSLMRTPQFV